ncbi:MAG TPA: HAD family phosphatase, partial [Erysipelotrichaceae bacterium]|nr:HAD family phosphatase [Erysipelotrichaceae bacterium]
DLLNYLNLKKATPNEGISELVEYFRQKHIKIAVFSTHKTSTAMDYLELGGLRNKVDYVIGSDTKLAPLPSTEMLSFLAGRYKVKADAILVITSIFALEKAAANLGMNVIFKEDLISATLEEKR